ncbi:MAG: glycosyltransferase family 4 protein [Nitrospinales bacterium]
MNGDAPINVLFVTTQVSLFGGIEETLRILCAHLDPGRFRIGLCVIQTPPREAAGRFEKLGVRLFPLGREGYFFDPLTTLAVAKVIRQFKADIVHTHNNKANLHGRLAARFVAKARIATTHHDLDDARFAKTPAVRTDNLPGGWVKRTLFPFLNIAFNRFNQKIIAVSNAVAKVYALDGRASRLEVVYAPFDENVFNGGATPFRDDRLVLGSVGRLEWEKGFQNLLAAFRGIADRHAAVRLDLVGEGSLRPQLESEAEKVGLASRVRFRGALPHDAAIYKEMDVYIQPAISEGSSITILEAMGMGIPVVATDSGGPAELILHGETGLLTPAGNPAALEEAVLHLIENREEAIRMGQAGQRRAHDLFSSRSFIEKMTRIYQELAGQP